MRKKQAWFFKNFTLYLQGYILCKILWLGGGNGAGEKNEKLMKKEGKFMEKEGK